MTTDQHKKTDAAATRLWDIGMRLDDIYVQFHQVRNMLYVYDEVIEGDLDSMKLSDDCYAKHFLWIRFLDKAVVPGVIAQIQYGAHATFLKSFCSIWLLKGRKGVVNIGKCAVVTSFGYGINGVVISVQKLSGIVFDMFRIFTGATLKNRDVVCECQNNTN